MTEILETPLQETERAERPVLIRTFDVDATVGDGRTVHMRIVPFDEVQTVADGFGGVARGVPYQEQWMPGVFDHQIRAANRVFLNFEHQRGIAGVIGHGVELRQERDGYHAAFRVQRTPDGDKALGLIQEGVLPSASVQALPVKNVRSKAGIVQRVRAHLDAVASCRTGQYAGAVVTAIRAEDISEDIDDAITLDEEWIPVDIDPELVERCRRLGLRLPQRYVAHPAETDTPAEAGTSEDGTRPETENTTSLEE